MEEDATEVLDLKAMMTSGDSTEVLEQKVTMTSSDTTEVIEWKTMTGQVDRKQMLVLDNIMRQTKIDTTDVLYDLTTMTMARMPGGLQGQ